MKYSKKELLMILNIVRTAKIATTGHPQSKVGGIYFSLDTGEGVVPISKDDLVFKLKSQIKELENGG